MLSFAGFFDVLLAHARPCMHDIAASLLQPDKSPFETCIIEARELLMEIEACLFGKDTRSASSPDWDTVKVPHRASHESPLREQLPGYILRIANNPVSRLDIILRKTACSSA